MRIGVRARQSYRSLRPRLGPALLLLGPAGPGTIKFALRQKSTGYIKSITACDESDCRSVAGIAQNGTSEGARVSAAGILLDRGWGKAAQLVTSDEEGGPIIVQIVHRV